MARRLSGTWSWYRRTFNQLNRLVMKTPMLITALLLSVMACAQQPKAEPSSAILQTCLLGTGTTTWRLLGLSSDQLERVRRVMEACQEECDAQRMRKTDDTISTADGSVILSEVRGILSADQYRSWVAYCAGSGTGSPPR